MADRGDIETGGLVDEIDRLWERLTLRCAQLSVHTGLVCSIASRYPAFVQEGFIERLEDQIAWLDQQIHEIHDFGSGHDD